MKITTVKIERTFNLGNYESEKVSFEAQLSEGEKPLEVSADLEMLAHQHIQNMKQQPGTATTRTLPKPVAPAQTTPPPQPNRTAAEMANENQRKKEQAAKADPNVCPKCGGRKKPEYDLCYTCHEAEKTQ